MARRMEDARELAGVLVDVDSEDDDALDDALRDRWEFGMEQFENLVNELLLLTYPVQSPFGDYFHAFGTFVPGKPGVWEAFLRTEADVVPLKNPAADSPSRREQGEP